MKKVLSLLLLILMFFDITTAQLASADSVQWLSFDQVKQLFLSKPKPILIYLYQPDNDSCKLMEKNTFANQEVAKYINVLFYPIKFDITTYDTIIFFNGQKFIHQPQKPYHQLTYTIMGDSIKVPALLLFDKNRNGRLFYGYKDRDHIFPILIYYSEEIYQTTQYKQWEQLYFKTYPPGVQTFMTRLLVKWRPIDQIDSLMKQKPKKILIDVYDRYRVSATVMRLQAYNNPVIAKYINEHFYLTTVEARAKDTIVFNHKKFGPSDKYPYHTLAIDLLNGLMKFPAFVILDTNYQLLDKEQVFLTPENFYKIISFFGGDYYKQMSFQEYLEKYKDQLQEQIQQIQKYYQKRKN